MTQPKIEVRWDAIDIAEWENVLATLPYATPLQQHWAYGEVGQLLGSKTLRAEIRYDDTRIGIAQINVARKWKLADMCLAMRGPLWLEEVTDGVKAQVYKTLSATLPARWLRYPLWMPETDDHAALRKAGCWKMMSPYHTAILNLRDSEEALLAAMDGKWRNRLRAAEKSELSISPVGTRLDQYQWLLEKEEEQRQRVGYAALNHAMLPLYQQQVGKKSLLIRKATMGTEIVAGMLCIMHGHTATYHIGWSSELGKKHNAHNLLMWESITALKAQGMQWLDMGGITTDAGVGIARFKLGTGARPHSLCGTYY